MANGKMLDELRNMAEDGDKDVSTRTMFRMTLSALSELNESVKVMRDEMQSRQRCDEDIQQITQRKFEELEGAITQIGKDVAEIKKQTSANSDTVSEIRGNYFIRMGNFIKLNPKTAILLALIFLTVFNVWLSSDLSKVLFQYIGIDPSIRDYLLPTTSTATPYPTYTPNSVIIPGITPGP